jgi:NAD(P)H dehydrogenase (quinone)
MSDRIIVTGDTGNLGKKVIGFLLERMPSSQLSAFVRNDDKAQDLKAQGITVKLGNYDDHPSMLSAFSGIDKIYLISSSEIGRRLQQQISAINAAKEAGVKQVFFTSFQRTTEDTSSPLGALWKDYIGTEEVLKTSGLAYTVMKHCLYMEVILPLCERALQTETIYTPAGDGKVSFAAQADLAEAAANVLTTYGHENEIYEFSGPLSYSYADIANILSELSGKKITYVSPSAEIFQPEQLKAGIPVERSRFALVLGEAIRRGEFDHPDPTLEEFLGRNPLDPREFLKTTFGL